MIVMYYLITSCLFEEKHYKPEDNEENAVIAESCDNFHDDIHHAVAEIVEKVK